MAASDRITLKDVAARTGLSVAAVSMALRNHASLSAETKDRVKKVAAEMGYVPDPAMSALAAYRTRLRVKNDFSVIALISNWSKRDEWLARESAQQLLAGATDRARTLGYTLQHFWAREAGLKAQRLSDVLVARGIRGVILAPFEHPDDRLELDWKKFSVVTIERPVHYACFHHIVPNYFADMLLVWEQLRARGYRRVGLVIDSDLAERVAHQWEAAHAFEQSRAKAERVPTLVVGSSRRTDAIRKWLRQHHPDAVISRTERSKAAEGVLEAAAAERLKVPGSLGYVGLNVVDEMAGVSGILQRRDVMGATAVDILNSLLQRNHRGTNETSQGSQIDGSWFEGKTLRPAAVVHR